MMKRLFNSGCRRRISWMMLSVLTSEMLAPHVAHALSSGPVQPEAQSFEPVGTTDMVDLFTGDFVYNIPLMDVEGYPVNISYHGGVTMEQEASWVGLGWNISPGAINRGMRGLPDEFDGETIEKELNVKDEITKRFGIVVGAELLGIGEPYISIGANLGGYLIMSNYRGVSADFTASAGINTNIYGVSAGLNVGASIGSQSGTSVNYGASIGLGASHAVSSDLFISGSANLNTSGVYSPRAGMKQDWGAGASVSTKLGNAGTGMSTGATVPIGLQNYTAAVTNASYMNAYSGQLKLGGEVYGIYLNGKVSGSISTLKFDKDGSRKGYGYFNLDKATDKDLLDFSREKDGVFNTTMEYLPQSHLTYDVYNVTGQGTGGSFRPIRNDIGAVYDPLTASTQSSEAASIEAGLGNLFEIGGEYIESKTSVESGPWSDYKRPFKGRDSSGSYEDVYFKEAGELTAINEDYANSYGNTQALTPEEVRNIPLRKPGAEKRVVRSNYIYPVSGKDEDTAALLDSRQLVSYNDPTGFRDYPNINKTYIPRVDASSKKLKRRTNHITEIVQVQKDGRRYIYGLPVMNNVQREATFAVDTSKPKNHVDKGTYLVNYDQGVDDSKNNGNGLDHFYSGTVTPSYVSAHLLTGVLSKDYVDVTGDGMTDDDLGSYTRFNYTRKSSDYRWRSPLQSGKAQYIPGYMTDRQDDKASIIIGSREQWLLHSIETRNYVAEFYTSQREDGQGVLDRILYGNVYNEAPYDGNGSASENKSYKLDSIVLYNKHDRFINGVNAVPVKTAIFNYDYSLCQGVPNRSGNGGKLTLLSIQVRFGNSNMNLSAAYKFNYANNYPYSIAAKDRWGMYKPNDPAYNNYEQPYTDQDLSTDIYSKAWSLSDIRLPSGGVIKVDYESDDYAYVQDKLAMEMFSIKGIGNTKRFDNGDNQLYYSVDQPNLYFYFRRRQSDENSQLTMRENYLKETNILYYNIPVELKPGLYEPIKGYAEVQEVGICDDDNSYGYVRVAPRTLEGTSTSVNPVVFTALNVGRYSLPHILYPGSDPESTDMDNVVAGLKNSIEELFSIHKNPLQYLISQGKAQETDLNKAVMRLNSPGLAKKGGGQRVKSIRFFDSWNAMAGGQEAVYGKVYDYSMEREDGKGRISSGVASYEPLIGGDELPQRIPSGYQAQGRNRFPPNDPVELYTEMPILESFYPSPVVGYRQVTARSIHADKGRSSQSEDISGFYTARDFPIVAVPRSLSTNYQKNISLTDVSINQTATQGFSLLLNDMHGKARNTEHWLIKPADSNKRELLNFQKYEYYTDNGQLGNTVPTFDYDAGAGRLNVTDRKMATETDITIDSRIRKEEATMHQVTLSVNGFLVAIVPIVVPLPYWFGYGNNVEFKCATATKVTQQYGILSKVISNNQGAITELRNEVFDAQTGNALVTSVNNQYGDRVYNVNYPAYWAYKELGAAYANQNVTGVLGDTLRIDTLGVYASRFVNYNDAFSSHYALPSNMPVGQVIVDEGMPLFKLGDELLLQRTSKDQPVRAWVMGYTSDVNHCYLVLATREPYKQSAFWSLGSKYPRIIYRVIRSGYRNRLGETIQSYTTTDRSNIFPYLKDSLTNLINLNAVRFNHNKNQVFAANQVSDSLNPFVTGKVGLYRPERQIVNLKKRDYTSPTARNAGVYNSMAYWRTEQDNFSGYCPDSVIYEGSNSGPSAPLPVNYNCANVPRSFSLEYLGGDSVKLSYTRTVTSGQTYPYILVSGYKRFYPWSPYVTLVYERYFNIPNTSSGNIIFHHGSLLNYFDGNIVDADEDNTMTLDFGEGCVSSFKIGFKSPDFTIQRLHYQNQNGSPAIYTNYYEANPPLVYVPPASVPVRPPFYGGTAFITPYRVRKKILLGQVGHYDNTDNEEWINTQHITRYNWYGEELESHEEGLGYNAAVYGYGQQLPVCVAKNARHSEVLFESFEDYGLLNPRPGIRESYMPLLYSPFAPFLQSYTMLGLFHKVSQLVGANGAFTVTAEAAHTGLSSMKVVEDIEIPLNGKGSGMADGYSYAMTDNQQYIASVWARPITRPGNSVVTSGYSPFVAINMDTAISVSPTARSRSDSLQAKSVIIDGWQQFEIPFTAPAGYKQFKLWLSKGYYYDDIRIYPAASNSKGFVYHPMTRKLMATLDENNYATFFEYDPEGNLVRTKKETNKGILTLTESRNTHHKAP